VTTDAFVESHPEGVILRVRVIPRASKPGLAGTRDHALLVRLSAPPVEGAANAELIDLLARALGVPKRSVSIVSGDRSRVKRVLVRGVSADRAGQALSGVPGGPDASAPPDE
jgi:uncharacterized protein (TIGR00251 family)